MKKKILLILCFLISQNIYAESNKKEADENDPVKVQSYQSNFMGAARIGGSYSKTQDRQGDENYGDRFFLNGDVVGRYSLSDSFAAQLGIGKWIGTGRVSAEAGSLAYNMSAGLIWAINGSMINRTTIETRIKKRKAKRGDKYYFITHTEKSTITNNLDGFRLGVHLSQTEFSRLDNAVYGVGASLYYEQRASQTTLWQYGVKIDTMTNSQVNAQLAQVFIGFGFLP